MAGGPPRHNRKQFANPWEQQVFEFRISRETTLSFPSSLTNLERKEIHRLCRKYGLSSKSTGKTERVLTVTKRGKVPEEDRYYTLPITRHSQFQLYQHMEQFPPNKNELFRAGLLNYETPEDRADDSLHKGSKLETETQHSNTVPASLNWTQSQVNHKWTAFQQYCKTKSGMRTKEFQNTLPVTQYRKELLAAIAANQVLLISGETGCGKTTQVPQFILDDAWSRGETCKIVCTQPRRLAAIMIATRVAEERGEALGQSVGYRIMLEKKEGPNSVLVYATTGTILRSLTNDAFSHEWTHLIIDEIHERDHYSDFLLILVRDLLPQFPKLKVVLMSATLHKELFIEYFENCPSFHIEGRMFPVYDYYLEDILPVLNKDPKSSFSVQTPSLSPESRVLIDRAIESAFLEVSESALNELEFLTGGGGHDMDSWINIQHSATGLTPLAVAVIHGYGEFVTKFLKRGANPLIKAHNGKDCLKWAHDYNRTEILQDLNEHLCIMESELALRQYNPPRNGDLDYPLLASLIKHLCDENKWKGEEASGSILVFLSGWKEIGILRQELLAIGLHQKKAWILCLHSSIAPRDQKLAFQRPGEGIRKIVLSTPIAETSITINDISVVINCGKMKEKSFDSESGVHTLQSRWISKANQTQRAGRAGRCQQGLAFHIYTKQEADEMEEFIDPEICRISLDDICLQARVCLENNKQNTNSIEGFLQKAPNPPSADAVDKAITLLTEIGALKEDQSLTVLGRRLASLPMDPKIGKMILYGILFQCLDPILTATCAISHKSPWVLSIEDDDVIRDIREKMSQPLGGGSDHLATIQAFNEFKETRNPDGFCRQNFLSKEGLSMIDGIKLKTKKELRARGMEINDSSVDNNSANIGLMRSVLACGLYPMLGVLSKKNRIRMKSRSVDLLGSSVNSVLKPEPYDPDDPPLCPLFVFDEITRGEFKVYVRDTTVLNPHPIPLVASDLEIKDIPESLENRQNFKLLVIDDWLHFLVDRSIAEALAVLRIRLQDAFANKVLAPKEPLPDNLEDAMFTISQYFSNESGIESLPVTMKQPKRRQNPGRFTGESSTAASFNGEGSDRRDQRHGGHRGRGRRGSGYRGRGGARSFRNSRGRGRY
eukprot:g3015.t1